MKKKLEAELISIAHRILKLKSNAELVQLQKEAQLLHEKLSVLVFVEEHFADAKPTIGRSKAEGIIEAAFEKEPEAEIKPEAVEVPEVVAEPVAETPQPEEDEKEEVQEDKIQEPEQPEEEKVEADNQLEIATSIEKEVDEVIAEAEEEVTQTGPQVEEVSAEKEEIIAQPAAEENKEDLFKPSFEWAFEAKSEEKPEQAIPNEKTAEPTAEGQIAFEDLLGAGYVDPVFVKPEESSAPAIEAFTSEPKQEVIPISRHDDKVPVFKMNNETATSLNNRLSKGSIIVGLNDRIAFVKNLFNNSNEDYNRVLSQLLTFDTYGEAQDFIDNIVKPDYNNWEGKDDYAQRFMEVVEKKFS